VWKGHRQRVFFEELFVNFKSVKKTRKVFDKTIEVNTVSFKIQVVFVLKSIKEAIEKKKQSYFLSIKTTARLKFKLIGREPHGGSNFLGSRRKCWLTGK